MQEQNYNLRPVWDVMLEIYEDFRRACNESCIRFFATGGTLLGAVRHQGFIPWDDDMDFLLRQDFFEKFLRIAPDVLPPYLKVIKWGRDTGFPFLFAKVQDTRQDKLEAVRSSSGLPLLEGLYLDLFPYSALPHRGFSYYVKSTAFRMYISSVCGGRKPTLKAKVGWAMGHLLRPFFPRFENSWDILDYLWEHAHDVPCTNAKHLGFYDCNLCRHTYCCESDWYREAKWVKFDKTEVPIPIGYDEMLKVHYGDYMKLPPLEKRRITHVAVPKPLWKID